MKYCIFEVDLGRPHDEKYSNWYSEVPWYSEALLPVLLIDLMLV